MLGSTGVILSFAHVQYCRVYPQSCTSQLKEARNVDALVKAIDGLKKKSSSYYILFTSNCIKVSAYIFYQWVNIIAVSLSERMFVRGHS